MYCNMGNMEKDLLCDRLVCGVKSDILHDKLLQTPNLSLQQCLELCRLSEHSSISLKSNMDFAQEEHIDAVHKVSKYGSRHQGDITLSRQLHVIAHTNNSCVNCNKCN